MAMIDTLDQSWKNKLAEAGTVEQALNVLDDYLCRELNHTYTCRNSAEMRELRKVRHAVRRAAELAEEVKV